MTEKDKMSTTSEENIYTEAMKTYQAYESFFSAESKYVSRYPKNEQIIKEDTDLRNSKSHRKAGQTKSKSKTAKKN